MSTHAVAYPLSWRISAVVLITISRGILPVLLALVLLAHDPPISPLMLMRAFAILSIAPAIAAWLIERAFAVTVRIAGGELVLERRELRVEIPCIAIARIRPWAIPLPGTGLWLHLRSGRRFRYGLQIADPTALVETLAAAGGPASARAVLQHPHVLYARAKHAGRP